MKGAGNGKPEQCTANLLLITRGEVPYERLKGLDRTLIDKPISVVNPEARADIEWMLGVYEPRMDIDSINLDGSYAAEGQFELKVDITNRR